MPETYANDWYTRTIRLLHKIDKVQDPRVLSIAVDVFSALVDQNIVAMRRLPTGFCQKYGINVH